METNTIIVIVIAAVIIVVLSYYTYSYKSQYDLIKEALGKDSTTLESLLVKVKAAETQQSISQKEIEDNRKLKYIKCIIGTKDKRFSRCEKGYI
jgi:Tfp pilus assembly protein PilE